MKISSIDLKGMINNSSANIKNDTSATDNKFQKLLSRNIDKTQRQITYSSEKLSSNSEVEVDKALEVVSLDNSDDESNLQSVIDINLLMSMLSIDKVQADKLSKLTKDTYLGDVKSLINSLNNLVEKQDNKAESNILNLLLQNDSSLKLEDANNLITSLKELESSEAMATNHGIEAVKVSLGERDTNLSALMLKENSEKNLVHANIESSEENEAEQNNILINEIGNKDDSIEQGYGLESNKDQVSDYETKEEKVLKSIINSDKKTDSKLLAFPAHLSRLSDSTLSVQNVTETMVVNKNNIVDDVVRVIRYMDLNNLKELTIKITPQDLGEMTIKITMEGNLLKASIAASNKDTYSLLNSNAVDLKNSLNNSMIKVQEVAINIYNEDTTFFSNTFEQSGQQYSGQNQRGTKTDNTISVEEAEILDLKEDYYGLDSNLNLLA